MKTFRAFAIFALGCLSCSAPAVAPNENGAAPAPSASLTTFHGNVIDVGGTPHVVLDTSVEEWWWDGKPTLDSHVDGVVVSHRPASAKLPERLSSAAGKRVRLYDDKGFRCEGELGAPVITQRIAPFEGDTSDGEGEPPAENVADEASVADSNWENSIGLSVAAPLTHVRGDCKGALFAKTSEAEVRLAPAIEPSLSVSTRALAALRASVEWKEIQAEYERDVLADPTDLAPAEPLPKQWDAYDGGSTEVRVMSTGRATFVWVAARAGEGCGGFNQELAFLFEEKPDGTLEPRWIDQLAHLGALRAMVHDANGAPELAFENGYLRSTTDGYVFESTEIQYLGCGC